MNVTGLGRYVHVNSQLLFFSGVTQKIQNSENWSSKSDEVEKNYLEVADLCYVE